MKTINDFYKEKREIYYSLKKFEDILGVEGRALTADEDKLYKDTIEKMEEVQRSIDLLKQMNDVRSTLNEPTYDGKGNKNGSVEERSIIYNGTVNKWMRGGIESLSAEERDLLKVNGMGGRQSIELRAVGNLTNSVYTESTGIFGGITAAKKYYGGWLTACDEINTGSGRQFNYPTVDDTSYTGAMEAAGTDAFNNSDAVTLGYKQLDAYIMSSQGVTANNDDLADADFDIGTELGKILGERLWRAIASYAMTGTGSSQPQGLARAAAKGLLTGNCTITHARVIQFLKTLDWAYMKSPGSGIMFHQSQLWDIMSLKSTTGQPLWQPSMAAGEPSTLMGLPYWISNELTSTSVVSANSRHMLAGDFKTFKIRYAGPTQLVRLTERYAEGLQTGFIALQRMDSELIAPNATTYNPVKYLRRLGT